MLLRQILFRHWIFINEFLRGAKPKMYRVLLIEKRTIRKRAGYFWYNRAGHSWNIYFLFKHCLKLTSALSKQALLMQTAVWQNILQRYTYSHFLQVGVINRRPDLNARLPQLKRCFITTSRRANLVCYCCRLIWVHQLLYCVSHSRFLMQLIQPRNCIKRCQLSTARHS